MMEITQDKQKQLIDRLTGKIEVGVALWAVAPQEFHDLVKQCKSLREQEVSLLEQLKTQANQLKILPFTSLECNFNYYWGSEIKHKFPYWAKGQNDLVDDFYFSFATNPANLLAGWLPYMVLLSDAQESRHIKIVKDVVKAMVPEKYTITGLSVKINPGHKGYYDAILLCYDNNIEFSGPKPAKAEKLLVD